MKTNFNSFFRKRIVDMRYDDNEIINIYIQLLKMKKKRSHINPAALLHKCYPNAKITIQKIIENHKDSITTRQKSILSLSIRT